MLDAVHTPDETALAEKVAFLRRANAYSPLPTKVDVVETHMSWVFLTDTLVYKLKKPVHYDFLDFSTLEARRLDGQREVELNQRLAPDVYLGLLPITLRSDGSLELGGPGAAVEWLVEMQRLPADRMLDAAIHARNVRSQDVSGLVRVLADFYRHAQGVTMSADDYRKRFVSDIDRNATELLRPRYDLDRDSVSRIAAAQQQFLQRHGALVEQRAREGRIVDAHGDLRPEHVCLTEPPKVIDCLEFNRDFRLLDPVDELSYLAMECARLGDAALGTEVLVRVIDATGERVEQPLVTFYKVFRAFLRARIAIAHISDHTVNDVRKWRRRANDYLALALACGADW